MIIIHYFIFVWVYCVAENVSDVMFCKMLIAGDDQKKESGASPGLTWMPVSKPRSLATGLQIHTRGVQRTAFTCT